MERLLLAIAKRVWPELETRQGIERSAGLVNLATLLYSLPLALLGLVWLVACTDLTLMREEWLTLAVLLSLIFLFQRLRFFLFMEVGETTFSSSGALDDIVAWCGALLLGPSALWMGLLWVLFDFGRHWSRTEDPGERWNLARNLTLETIHATLVSLAALALYGRWGGSVPLPDLSLASLAIGLYATGARALLLFISYAPFIVYMGLRAVDLQSSPSSLKSFAWITLVGLVAPALGSPFAILAAGLYSQSGWAAFFFFVAGLSLVSGLTRQLSQAVNRSHQRSRELAQLERLSRAILDAPPDTSTLPSVLREHVPNMFPKTRIEICRFPDQVLLHYPEEWPPLPATVWEWLRERDTAHHFAPRAIQPWDSQRAERALVLAPVLDSQTGAPVGGIYVAPRRDVIEAEKLLPAVQSLAAQVASALKNAQMYTQTLAHQRAEQELALAGEIQSRFLPTELPQVAGWQLTAALQPARQTSGDFYDVIPLPNGRLGLLVADVADKGTAAALFMALSRTLIRTYAVEHHARPDFALRVANNRILMDTHTDLFVTIFYGVLDPRSGKLTYCNAGHNPPYLFSGRNGDAAQRLTRTGIPLGIFKGETWEQKVVRIERGDMLLLYTDGITEAQDHQDVFFGEGRLRQVAQRCRGCAAQEIQDNLLHEVSAFVGNAPQFDDITLMVVVREE